jgi:hypothetical protein
MISSSSGSSDPKSSIADKRLSTKKSMVSVGCLVRFGNRHGIREKGLFSLDFVIGD